MPYKTGKRVIEEMIAKGPQKSGLSTVDKILDVTGTGVGISTLGLPKWLLSKIFEKTLQGKVRKKFFNEYKDERMGEARQMLTAQDPYMGEDPQISWMKRASKRRTPPELSEDQKRKVAEEINAWANMLVGMDNLERTGSRVGPEGVKAYGLADGGRIGLKDGHSPGRRKFLKLAAGLASIPVVGKFFKWAKPAAKVADVTSVPIKAGVEGMPVWFKPLVNKVIREGDDVTKQFAMKEREIVHQVSLEGKIGKDTLGMDDNIRVTQSLDDGTIRVQYNTVNSPGEYGVDLIYKQGEKIPTKKGSVKTKDEFSAAEAEPRYTGGPEDADIEWAGENVVNKVDDLLTDTTKLEAYATGKNPNIKKLLKSEQKQKKTRQLNESNAEQANFIEEKYGPGPDPSDYEPYASGGIARMLGE